MVKIESNLEADILDRIINIENALLNGFRQVEEKLSQGQETFQFFQDGCTSYRERWLKENQLSTSQAVLNKLTVRIQIDQELRFPHRKILDVLMAKYSYEKKQFEEINFSKLVKEARIGKNMANEYISLLESKGYIQKRTDGYRVFYKMKD